MTPTPKRRKKRKRRFRILPGVSLCSPPTGWGDIECAGLSTGVRRLHLCGDGAPGVPGSGLHLLRLGDWGLRRASNSIDRFNVAPQAMLAKQKQESRDREGKSRPAMARFNTPFRKLDVLWISPRPFFLSTTTDCLLLWVVKPKRPTYWIFKTSQRGSYHYRGREGRFKSFQQI